MNNVIARNRSLDFDLAMVAFLSVGLDLRATTQVQKRVVLTFKGMQKWGPLFFVV